MLKRECASEPWLRGVDAHLRGYDNHVAFLLEENYEFRIQKRTWISLIKGIKMIRECCSDARSPREVVRMHYPTGALMPAFASMIIQAGLFPQTRIMNFEFKNIGDVTNGDWIRYSTPGQGARTMNFEFKKV